MKRTSAVVRAWDGPNSRIAVEMDLDQMPWGPFEALGKRVTVLVPATAEVADTGAEAGESRFEEALRHVEHAAQKCAEFAQLGNGTDPAWRRSLDTWEWLRDYLTARWTEDEAGRTGAPAAPATPPSLPSMPGAAAALEVAAAALRHTSLSTWQEAVGTFNPDAPTREEAIQTLLGVARLLGRSGKLPAAPTAETPPSDPAMPAAGAYDPGENDSSAPESGASSPADAPAAAESPPPAHLEPDDLSFDYAAGYDEGYRMGRRVGRALAARERRADREG